MRLASLESNAVALAAPDWLSLAAAPSLAIGGEIK
jgi:hypothetical protein